MYKFILPVLFVNFFLTSQETFTLLKTNPNQIILDGIIDPDEWSNAVEIDFDIEFSPANNLPSRKKTTAYMTYSDRYLFLSIYAKDDPDNIRVALRQRDGNIWNDDLILLRLDPYTDARNNLGIAVNALGSQFDFREINSVTDDGKYDSSFNVNFQSSGKIVDDGYQIEIKIPFSEIPFPNGKNQLWHFNLTRRYIENGNEIQVSTQPRDRDNNCVICQTTDKLVLNNIVIDKRLELLPYISSNITGNRSDPDNKLIYTKPKLNVGLGLNLDINKNSSFELTVNPDFSQVEADVTQIDINSSFSLEYPERRPFFNRGTDIVKFTNGAFYSRSIVNPIVASKLLSQRKKSRIFLLNALDKNSPYLVGGEDRSYIGEGGRSFVNVLRFQSLLNPKSRLGGLMTNRVYDGGGYGHLLGFDGFFILNKKWSVNFELLKNLNKEPSQNWISTTESILGNTIQLDGEKLDGEAFYLQFLRRTEHWNSYFFFRNISPQHRADVGFVVKNNRKWGTLFHEYINIINKPALQSFGFGTKIDLVYTHENYYKTLSIDFFASLKTYGQTELEYTLDYDATKTFLGYRFDNLPTHEFSVEGSPSESINFNLNLTFGKDLSVNEIIPQVGKLKSYFIKLNYQINDNLSFNPSFRGSELKKLNSNDNYFKGNILRLDLRYQFTSSFNFRIISEKNNFNDQFFIQPLVQWNPNPATIFYFGGNQNTIRELNQIHFDLFEFNQTQLFFKFQYLIDI